MAKEKDLHYSVNDLDSMEWKLWGKIVFSNVEMIARNFGIQSVEKIEFNHETLWKLGFYIVRKNDWSIDLVNYTNEIKFNNKIIKPKELWESYTLNIWDTLIFWKLERKIDDFKENFISTKMVENGKVTENTSNISFEKLMWELLTWKCEIKK